MVISTKESLSAHVNLMNNNNDSNDFTHIKHIHNSETEVRIMTGAVHYNLKLKSHWNQTLSFLLDQILEQF